MKKLYYLLLIALVVVGVGCSSDDDDSDFNTIPIEKIYPFYTESDSLKNVDKNKVDLFKDKAMLINSKNQLKEKVIYQYYSSAMKEELESIDFNTYSLIMVSNSSLNIIDDIKFTFGYTTSSATYQCKEVMYLNKDSGEGSDIMSFFLSSFIVKKIPDNSNLALSLTLTRR